MSHLEYITLPKENRFVYPYGLMSKKEITEIEFAPITIFYGNNGSGKSTLLNIIAESIGIRNKSLGNTSEYFNSYVRKCTPDPSRTIPADATFIRSEDIMEKIVNIRKQNEQIDKKLIGWFEKGVPAEERGTLEAEMYAKHALDDIFDYTVNDSFYNHVKGVLFQKNDEQSNGESAMAYFKEVLLPDNLYILDEPENSMAPQYQQELAEYITILAYRLNCQFIIASHSPFMLSMDNARIYDLDSPTCKICKWYELPNMKTYYQLFKRFESKFNNKL